jgi:hypothetical protein
VFEFFLTVRFIDLETHSCGVIDVFGNVPVRKLLSKLLLTPYVAVLDS